jgi:hypothetical protein
MTHTVTKLKSQCSGHSCGPTTCGSTETDKALSLQVTQHGTINHFQVTYEIPCSEVLVLLVRTYVLFMHSEVNCPTTRHARAKGERSIASTYFFILALDGASSQCHAPAALYPWQRTAITHCISGWVGPRAGLDAQARGRILCLCRDQNPVVQSVVRHCTD